ncbi:MAG: PilZ domain-containing protein [Desulfobacterales bacterium]|jgi:hypothetical protein
MYRVDARKSFEKRTAPRQKYSGHILFATGEGLCEGELENFSRYGMFIKTRKPLPIGEIVTFAIPYSKNINCKRKGVVTWCNEKGFGVSLLVESNYGSSNVIPFKSK